MSDGEAGGIEEKDFHELSESVMLARIEDWINQQ